MIVTGEKAYLKSYDSKLHNDTTKQNEINNLVQIENQRIQDNKVTRKERKNSNNYIYKNIRNKAQTLNKINDIKGKLAQYKSKLIELESQINRKKHDVECREKLMESYVEVEESINENIIINPLDFISIEGDINTGILVNILI